jgi:hypothetical protein
MANNNPKWFFYQQKWIIETMSKKLVGEMKVDVPYIMKETNDSEVIFSIHFPFQIHSEFIEST